MNRLRNELAIADTAKIAYVNALKLELQKDDANEEIKPKHLNQKNKYKL